MGVKGLENAKRKFDKMGWMCSIPIPGRGGGRIGTFLSVLPDIYRTMTTTDIIVTREFLEKRTKRAAQNGFEKAKWILFCETLLERGYTVFLDEAKTTNSKYITVKSKHIRRGFRVRFSNHKPSRQLEDNGGCDFYVGVANKTVTTWIDALVAIDRHFHKKG